MQFTSDVEVVRKYSLLSLIAIAILEDGVSELARYMREAGYHSETHQLITVRGVSLHHEEPVLEVHFRFELDNQNGTESGIFFISIKPDFSVAGEF